MGMSHGNEAREQYPVLTYGSSLDQSTSLTCLRTIFKVKKLTNQLSLSSPHMHQLE